MLFDCKIIKQNIVLLTYSNFHSDFFEVSSDVQIFQLDSP